MIGIVLAAGAGRRLRPWTDSLPKSLIPVDRDRTILDVLLGTFRAVPLERAVIVTGHAANRIAERLPNLESRRRIYLDTIFNEKAGEWNNAYSLWCAREQFGQGVVLANGDTVVPTSALQRLLGARGTWEITLAVDDHKPLGAEEMKVQVDGGGALRHINKGIAPSEADGEYVGLAVIEPSAAEGLAAALRATFERDPQLY
ncbi:MAG: NTP transferase domain-containing protein, partial [Chloroflexota bacterium]|nr:NTP transferase domain-containing protein [Chloroflexota bacterium]